MGTLAYMAPELLRGETASPAWGHVGPGLVAHEMLTGSHPFALYGAGIPGAEPPQAGASLGPAARHFFQQAPAIEPERRCGSAAEFIAAFEALIPLTDRIARRATM